MSERGHPKADLWNCTPRELIGWLYFSERVRKRRRAQFLSAAATATRADKKDVNKEIDKLTR